ncbi:MAG: GNAT family N-acetyltransferase [Bacteroidetes bacterium]|nr:GNAT family N-acetyltransferase [Bacteroidota bacterium]
MNSPFGSNISSAAKLSLVVATLPHDFHLAKSLFQQYANSLSFNLCFQDFENELKQLHVQYNKPTGALILAFQGETAIGCVGVRQFDNGVAELKRMFVLPDYRKSKIGQRLLEEALKAADELGYQKIRLDTLQDMVAARSLYRQNGFYEITPYRHNPIAGAIYMEKVLNP